MKNYKDILISVILPIYNGAEYIDEAIQSILNQTYTNFECIIINDGSTDDSASVIKKNMDSRICFYEQENQGLAATLNRAISLAKGKYVARQDQDDISLPRRFEKQVDFLESHPDHGMVGTWASITDMNGKSQNRAHKHPSESLILKFEMLFNNPFVHSSVMIRKSVFEKAGVYSTDESRQPPEDYELWSRIAREFKVANIPEILHIYREVSGSMSRDGVNPFLDHVITISSENIALHSGKPAPDKHCTDCAALFNGAYHRLSSRPSFTKISQLIHGAADTLSLSHGIDRNILRTRARERLQVIKFPCLSRAYGKRLGRLINHFHTYQEQI